LIEEGIMLRKEDVRFPAEGGIELSAWLFVPQNRNGRVPAMPGRNTQHRADGRGLRRGWVRRALA